jgi:hypothetical protein
MRYGWRGNRLFGAQCISAPLPIRSVARKGQRKKIHGSFVSFIAELDDQVGPHWAALALTNKSGQARKKQTGVEFIMRTYSKREPVSDIEKARQKLKDLEAKQVRTMGRLVLDILGTETTLQQLAGALSLTRTGYSRDDWDAAGASYTSNRPVKHSRTGQSHSEMNDRDDVGNASGRTAGGADEMKRRGYGDPTL